MKEGAGHGQGRTPGAQERDLDTLRRLQGRDEGALGALYDRYGTLLYSVALRILGSQADAEDVVQETWLQVWRQASSYDARRGPVGAWLVVMVRSRALDRYRSLASRQRAESTVDPSGAPPPDDPAAMALHAQLHERLVGALGTLQAEQRQVLELAYFGGLSQSEIAARLGAPLGTVKSWTRQGLIRLRELVPKEQWE